MKQSLIWISGGAFAVGIALAGSDGDWFPWINIAGVILIWASLWGLERLCEE